jgi:hypothetical protein
MEMFSQRCRNPCDAGEPLDNGIMVKQARKARREVDALGACLRRILILPVL